MSTAHDHAPDAPPPSRTLKRHVTFHAVQRLRDRLTKAEDLARGEWDLKFLLDEVVGRAIGDGRTKVIYQKREPSTLVPLEPRFPKSWAVIGPNTKPFGPPQAIITVLTDAMVQENYATGWWVETTPDEHAECRVRTKAEDVRIRTPLSEALKDIKVAAPTISAPAVPTAHEGTAPHWVIAFELDGQLHYERVDEASVLRRANAILATGTAPKIFREVSLTFQFGGGTLPP